MRKKRLPRIIVILVGVVCVLAVFSLIIFWQWPDQYLHIVVCDVGQGDAILISQGFTQVLVDAGLHDEDILQCLREQLSFWDRQIEWVVPTHLDADHIGGLTAVLDRFVVLNILLPAEGTKQTAAFERFEQAVLREQRAGGQVFSPKIGAIIPVQSSWKLSVIYAPIGSASAASTEKKAPTEEQLWDAKAAAELNPADSNNRSTVLSLQFDQVSLLLTGDLEAPVEQALVNRGMVTDHTILKVGHHGSKSSSSEAFLEVVRPEVALISAGKKNRYGHPAPVILRRLAQFGAKQVLRTDEQGTIVLKTDGQRLWQVKK